MIDSVARLARTVLITGESGTGKSLIARAIHRRSNRRDEAFVEVACGALPENLLESELFGHVAGAFTGAMGNKEGTFKQADGGTIFLDEIGTASPSMQVKLLRVCKNLPNRANKMITVDGRIILATNEDSAQSVASGRFRQDLYYRINVINSNFSLHERARTSPLADHFLQRVCQSPAKIEGLARSMEALQAYQGRATSANFKISWNELFSWVG
jgi:transcriptional regulator with GAF, ATPase, and Fis domain